MRLIFASCLLAVVSAAKCADQTNAGAPLPEVADSGIGYHSPQEALDALKIKPGVTISLQQGWIVVQDPGAGDTFALWSFVPESHPAYPAVVKRSFEKIAGVFYVNMKVKCGGTKEACDSLVRDFQALNERMRKYAESHLAD
jgi:hypothetical protein